MIRIITCTRLGTSREYWADRLRKFSGKSRILGRYFAVDLSRLREVAARRGVHYMDNTVAVA